MTTINSNGIPQEALTFLEVRKRCLERKPFKTAQMWGREITPWIYVFGSTSLMNDNGEDRVLAVVNYIDQILPVHPLTYLPTIEEYFKK